MILMNMTKDLELVDRNTEAKDIDQMRDIVLRND